MFLELGRFNKKIWELDSVFDKWMYLLKHIHEMEEIPKKFSDPLFTRLFLLAKIGSFTADELKQYKQSLESMGDYENIINTAREEAEKVGWAIGHAHGYEQGHAEGHVEGHVEGRAEEKKELAKKMLEAGIPLIKIVEITGLTSDEIQ